MHVTSFIFGEHENNAIKCFVLDNGQMEVRILNYGAIIQSIILRSGKGEKNVVLQYPELKGYMDDTYYIGAVVGRVANRIADAKFELDGRQVSLTMNEPALHNHIHGGFSGFNKKVFVGETVASDDDKSVLAMHYDSTDGEEGYPGNLRTTVTYTLTTANELLVEFDAVSDATTHVNITQHTYFNLNGTDGVGNNHYLQLNANKYLASDSRFLPVGPPEDVDNTRYDFTSARRIFDDSGNFDRPIYNTWFQVLETSVPSAVLESEDRQVRLKLSTSYPGILLYSGDYLDHPFKPYGGICLECQFAPNAPNMPGLTGTRLKAGEEYRHYIKYYFEWQQ